MDEQALRNYYEFDESDLEANRNGRLSDSQRRKLLALDKGTNPILIGLVVIFFAVASIFPLVYRQVNPATVIWVLIWGGLGCYVLYCILFPSSTSIAKITVKKAEGPIRFVAVESGSSGNELEYELRIGKVKLDREDHELTDIMKAGDVFAVYYYDRKDGTGNHILSAQWLSAGK
ncbi:MAG TPA: hypothetical protein VMT91_07955 [Anaerolineales bacterium]|nr:hypothetical protein [Anaerolineales bacterium]